MKKFILKTTGVLIVLLITSLVVSSVLEKYRYSNPFFTIPTTTNKIIIGSSRAYHNLLIDDPTICNLTKPNLYLADTYNLLSRLQIPEYIDTLFIEFQDVNYSTDKNQKFFDGPSQLPTILSSPFQQKSVFLENAVMNYTFTSGNLKDLFPPKPITVRSEEHDYKAMREHTNERQIIRYLQDSLGQNSKAFYGLPEEKRTKSIAMAELISKKLRKSNPNTTIVFFTSFGVFFKAPSNIDGRTVLDLRKNLVLEKEDIYDYRHLTISGAEKMTKIFISEISTNPRLTR